MKNGTKEEYLFLTDLEDQYAKATADRVLAYMERMDTTLEGYQISRLEHSLQTASRALRDEQSDEFIVAALLHDIGDELAPLNHGEYAASILKPYVSVKTHWIVEKHGIFQSYYYANFLGRNRYARERYARSEHYRDTVRFCELYDQNSFDPNYKSLSLQEFEPYVNQIFSREPYSQE